MDLAIFGGSPAFSRQMHVGRPNIGNRKKLLDRMNEILDSGWLTNHGPMVTEFEKRLSNYLGVGNCISVCNGTIALEITIRALDLKGEVIVPSFTFIAIPHALQWQGITPIFADINPITYNICPKSIESLITSKTTGIIGVHTWGVPCDIETIDSIALENNLKVIYDGSHAFAVTNNSIKIGNFGNAEVFSFHATKFVNTFEGGVITTNDDELAKKIRLMTNFGFAGMDNVIYLGTNGKMAEISAAMGLTSLENLEEFIAINRENYSIYKNELERVDGIKIIKYNEDEGCNFQYIVIEIDSEITNISRDSLISILHAENVLARRYFYPGCHRMEPYRSQYPNSGENLQVTEQLSEKIICLPTGVSISKEEIRKICEVMVYSVTNGKSITKKLEEHKTQSIYF